MQTRDPKSPKAISSSLPSPFLMTALATVSLATCTGFAGLAMYHRRSPRDRTALKHEKTMIENQKLRPSQVIGPLGEPLTLDNLPPPSTTRWVVRRKAELVAAVDGGLLTFEEVCERYGLTLEEFAGWKRAVERSGMPGLRVTRIQHYKSLYDRQQRY